MKNRAQNKANKNIDANLSSCGADWMPVWLRSLLFGWFFDASCQLHDQQYDIGGNELRRLQIDIGFLNAMLRDTTRLKWWQRQIAMIVAIIFFMAVRLFGWTQFNYMKKEVKR